MVIELRAPDPTLLKISFSKSFSTNADEHDMLLSSMSVVGMFEFLTLIIVWKSFPDDHCIKPRWITFPFNRITPSSIVWGIRCAMIAKSLII